MAEHDRSAESRIDPRVVVGHVHLKVSDLERAVRFYAEVLGFEVTQRMGTHAAFLSAGGYHHHVGLNTWESAGGAPPPPGTTGLSTSPSAIRHVPRWAARFGACSSMTCDSTGHRTTG